jgi:DMSO reductase family type II enzyme heme b subunit
MHVENDQIDMTSEPSRFRFSLTPRIRALVLLGIVLGIGVSLSALNVPLASSAANAVDVQHITEAVPEDPQSDLWDRTKEAEIALSAQQIYQPGGGTTRAVRVRALEDGQDFAVRISWDDDTMNDTLGSIPTDAAAVQLPIDPTHLPYQCMGQTTSRVNIWQWKAAWEREAENNLGMLAEQALSAGARNYTSNGICKAVETAGISPNVQSSHDGQAWHVVFKRRLHKGEMGTAPLDTSIATSIAFAVWNGARGEVRGMKAVSTWNTLTFDTPEESNAGNLVTLGVVILASIGIVIYAMRRMAG